MSFLGFKMFNVWLCVYQNGFLSFTLLMLLFAGKGVSNCFV